MTVSRIFIAVFVGLGAVAAYGQIPAPAPGTPDPNSQTNPAPAANTAPGARDSSQPSGKQNNQAGTPANPPADAPSVPGSVDPNAPVKIEGPDIVDDPNATPEQKASAEYSGPAVLSRGISASLPMNPKSVKFTPTIGLEFMADSGLTGVEIQSNGKAVSNYAEGVNLNFGVTGEKVLKKDTFSLIFSGTLYHYFQDSQFDGTSDQLAFAWQHKVSRHLSFGIHESAEEYNNNNLLLSGSQLINSGAGTTLVTAAPSTEAFDGRVYSLFTEANLTWQMSSRFSINLSGGEFLTRRASTSLYGDTGYQAGADIAYRLTRSTTLGGYYQYTNFDITGTYGTSDIHTVGLTYSVAFSKYTELITRIGGSRLETTGLESVALNPFLASLFGTPQTIEAVYLKNFVPDVNVQLRHKVTNFDLSLAYARGVTPGNGVILTSIRQTASFGVNYKAGRYWNFTSTGGYDSLSGYGVTNEKYESVFLNASVYRKLRAHLDWHTRLDYHHYTFNNTGYLQNTVVLATGVVWSPGDVLERLW